MIKKILLSIFIFLWIFNISNANFTNDFSQIKSWDFAIIIKETEKWNFIFKEKNYNADFWIEFLTDFSNDARIKIDNEKLKNFLEWKYFEKDYFLIIITKNKNIILEKINFLNILMWNYIKNKNYDFAYDISENDFIFEIITSSSLESNFIKSKLIKNNNKIKKLFENIDEKSLNILKEKFKNSDNHIINIFIKLLENEVYNSWKNIILK